MAIEDGQVLAELLATCDIASAWRAFEARRFDRTASITRESLWAGRLGLMAGRLGCLRDAVTRATPTALVTARLNRHYRAHTA